MTSPEKITVIAVSLLFCFTDKLFSEERSPLRSDSLVQEIEKDVKSAIRYLQISQIQKTDSTNAYEGEWPSFIINTENIPFIGKKGKSAYDSNCFNTAFIHNTLAEIAADHPEYAELSSVLEKAQKNILLFRTGNTFNFWHLLPPAGPVNKKKHKKDDVLVLQRRANHFIYRSRMINRYENIYDDADDTAVGLLAMHYAGQTGNKAGSLTVHMPVGPLFSKYRDIDKRKTNWYNKKNGFNYRTGAFLTWFGQERRHNNFFRWFFPDKDKQNILYGTNDVDCVVNANVIRTLAVLRDTNTEGYAEACAFVNSAIATNRQFSCGVYYPTEFTLHYAVSKALAAGAGSLAPSKEKIVRQVLSLQKEDGSWESEIGNNDLQASLYALNTLLQIGEYEKYGTMNAIEKAIAYVHRSAIHEGEVTYWLGGVFFSGGSVIRYTHIWRSDAFTTALAVEAFTGYADLLKNKK